METDIFKTKRPFSHTIHPMFRNKMSKAEKSILKAIERRSSIAKKNVRIVEKKAEEHHLSPSPSPTRPVSVIESHQMRGMKVSNVTHKRPEIPKSEEINVDTVTKLIRVVERRRRLLQAAMSGDPEYYRKISEGSEMSFLNDESQWNLRTPREYMSEITERIEGSIIPLKPHLKHSSFKVDVEDALSKARSLPYRKVDHIGDKNEGVVDPKMLGKTEKELLIFLREQLKERWEIRKQSIFKPKQIKKPNFLATSSGMGYSRDNLVKKPDQNENEELENVPSIEFIKLPMDMENFKKKMKSRKSEDNLLKLKEEKGLTKTRSQYLAELCDLGDMNEYVPTKDYIRISRHKFQQESTTTLESKRGKNRASKLPKRAQRRKRFSHSSLGSLLLTLSSKSILLKHKPKIKQASRTSQKAFKRQRKIHSRQSIHRQKEKALLKTTSEHSVKREKSGIKIDHDWTDMVSPSPSGLKSPMSGFKSRTPRVSIEKSLSVMKTPIKEDPERIAKRLKYKKFINEMGIIVSQRKKDLAESLPPEKEASPDDKQKAAWLRRASYEQSWQYDADFEKRKQLMQDIETVRFHAPSINDLTKLYELNKHKNQI